MPPSRATQVIVLNGGSSSGKSSIARALQERLSGLWLTFGIDVFIDALPGRGDSPRADITLRPDGTIETGSAFQSRQGAWYLGLAAMVRGGAPIILDDVFLSGATAQESLRATLHGLHVLWAGIHCDPNIAAAREAQRLDRVPGMARNQAHSVHIGVHYDVEVETNELTPDACARLIAACVNA